MIRKRLSKDLSEAIESADTERAATLRLICAAIKARDLACQTCDSIDGVPDPEITEILAHMIRQRQEAVVSFEEAGQIELAEQERREIKTISGYLPRKFSESEMRSAVDKAILDTGAQSIRDIGRVMAHLKARHAGRMDFCEANSALKDSFR